MLLQSYVLFMTGNRSFDNRSAGELASILWGTYSSAPQPDLSIAARLPCTKTYDKMVRDAMCSYGEEEIYGYLGAAVFGGHILDCTDNTCCSAVA